MGVTRSTTARLRCPVAIVGAGPTAADHIRAFDDVPNASVVGIHSRTINRSEELAHQHDLANVCESISDLYESTQAELVVVAVSVGSMEEVALACLDWPWSVLLEKPPGINLASALRIDRHAVQNGRNVMVGLNRRFLASTQLAHDQLATNHDRRFVYVRDQQDIAAARRHGHPDNVVENFMYANSIHLVDYLRHFGRGDVVNVDVQLPWDQDRPWLVLATVTFSSGDVGVYEGVWSGPGPWSATVTTEQARWEMRPLETATRQEAGSRDSWVMEPDPIDVSFKPGFRRQADEVVRSSLGRANTAVSLTDAIQTMQLIHDIFELD